MIGLLTVNLWVISPRLEEGWPVHFPPTLEGYPHIGVYPSQPFGGGWAYYDECLSSWDSVHAFTWNGRYLPGWPKPALVVNDPYSLCLGDVDCDGGLDVIYAGDWGATSKIYARKISTAEVLPGWPVTFGKFMSPPSLWDMDGDGCPEVIAIVDSMVAGGPDRVWVHILDSDGSDLPGWPMNLSGWTGWLRPAVGDPDGDGVGELIFMAGNSIYMFDDQANLEPGWPFILGQDLPSHWCEVLPYSPFLVDLDRDGKQEIVFSTVIMDTVASNETMLVWVDTSRIFALGHDGTLVPGWPVVLRHGRFLITPGDYDGDGLPELFLRYDRYIFLGPSGEIKCSFDKMPFGHIMTSNWRGVADTDGDGRAELIFSGVQFIGYETSTDDTGALRPYTVGLVSVDCLGREIWRIKIGSNLPPDSLSRPYSFWSAATPTFSDVDRDGFLELSHNFTEELGEGCNYYYHIYLYTWEIPGVAGWRIDWSGPAHDPWNTNNYDFWPDNPAIIREANGNKEGFALSVFPNPARGTKLDIRLTLPSSSPVLIKAYDPAGRMVLSQDMGLLGPGLHTLELAVKPGVYFLAAEAGSWTGRTKGVVVR